MLRMLRNTAKCRKTYVVSPWGEYTSAHEAIEKATRTGKRFRMRVEDTIVRGTLNMPSTCSRLVILNSTLYGDVSAHVIEVSHSSFSGSVVLKPPQG